MGMSSFKLPLSLLLVKVKWLMQLIREFLREKGRQELVSQELWYKKIVEYVTNLVILS